MKNINVMGAVGGLGYGVVCTNVVKELSNIGLNVSLFPQHGRVEKEVMTDTIHNAIQRGMTSFSRTAPCLKIWHQNAMAEMVGSPHIGWPIFELDTLLPDERHHINSCDSIVVCSDWAKSILSKNDITVPIHVVPLGVDTSVFNPQLNHAGPTIFCNIGKWEFRKGHDFIIEAFNLAFSNKDDVRLLLCCDNPFYNRGQEKYWEELCIKNPKINIIHRLPTHEHIANLIRSVDCGIFPARAEGWNLELLEFLSCGKHVITTNYSGHTEFCNPNNAALIEVDELEPAHDKLMPQWFYGQGNWAKLGQRQLDCTIEHMRKIHALKSSGSNYMNSSGIDTAKQLTWTNTANTLVQVLKLC